MCARATVSSRPGTDHREVAAGAVALRGALCGSRAVAVCSSP